jgi:hypothetical protein
MENQVTITPTSPADEITMTPDVRILVKMKGDSEGW